MPNTYFQTFSPMRLYANKTAVLELICIIIMWEEALPIFLPYADDAETRHTYPTTNPKSNMHWLVQHIVDLYPWPLSCHNPIRTRRRYFLLIGWLRCLSNVALSPASCLLPPLVRTVKEWVLTPIRISKTDDRGPGYNGYKWIPPHRLLFQVLRKSKKTAPCTYMKTSTYGMLGDS